MRTELEIKYHPIDLRTIQTKLHTVGAALKQSELLQRRIVYKDLPIADPTIESRFVRVRDEGDRVTLTYKTFTRDRVIEGQQELEVVVSDFDDTVAIMDATGMQRLGYQENRREVWELAGCEICLDTWPAVGSLIEIEGPSEKVLKKVSETLGFGWESRITAAVGSIYQKVYGVTIQGNPEFFEHLTFEKNRFTSIKLQTHG